MAKYPRQEVTLWCDACKSVSTGAFNWNGVPPYQTFGDPVAPAFWQHIDAGGAALAAPCKCGKTAVGGISAKIAPPPGD